MKSKWINSKNLTKAGGMILTLAAVFFAGTVMAQTTQTIGNLATNLTATFQSIGELIIGIAFVGGLGFTMAAIFKFKQHKDNPTQIPLGTPIAMLAIGIVLIFLPSLIAPAGTSFFGTSAQQGAGGFTGSAGLGVLPGATGGGGGGP